MILDLESLGGQLRNLGRAGVDVIHPIALLAVKMVMMIPGQFKAGWLPRKLNDAYHLLFDKRIQVPIDRRQIQIRNDLFGTRQDLLGE